VGKKWKIHDKEIADFICKYFTSIGGEDISNSQQAIETTALVSITIKLCICTFPQLLKLKEKGINEKNRACLPDFFLRVLLTC